MFVNANWAHALRGQIKAGLSFYNVGPPLEHTSWLENRQICRMGMSSGWRCGRFLQANMKYTINGVPFYLSEAEVCASPGDSGGPMILSAGNNALGLLTGAKNDNSSGRGTCAASVGGGSPPITLFQPIMPIIRAHPGLTIMTR
ncbi:trypsin-like serine protease [Vandammella animalimorsus]|uniref:trypsin-like serine protease n=1 Tax=Vandammella animalimorsus TaxID=2029117 RepID=UPI0011C3E9E1|nr:trypsin-like serine protease [Vandammella animalimorsus]